MAHINIYELITNKIIEELEKGAIPWQKPWTGIQSGARSWVTGKAYSLINQFLLPPGEYLTYQQAKNSGGQVRKGEKGHIVVFWKPLQIKEEDKEGNSTTKTIPFLRYYNVFEISQCDGLKHKWQDKKRTNETVKTAENIINQYLNNNTQLKIIHQKQDKAYYSPLKDEIHLPLLEQFNSTADYYNTKFRELVHSTGHKSRLNRIEKTASFGDKEYSKEELVAEIGAAMLMNITNTETPKNFKNSASYINGWLQVLKNDKKLIVSASSKAQKAIDYILIK